MLSDSTSQELPDYDPTSDLPDYQYPAPALLNRQVDPIGAAEDAGLESHKNKIINTLKNFDISISKITATVGPNVTLYEIVPASGVRLTRIRLLEEDIALGLSAPGIRMIVPLPGTWAIGIEIPNKKSTASLLHELLESDIFKNADLALPIAVGKTTENRPYVVDLAALSHLLIGGATGQGKSMLLHSTILSLLYKKHPSQLKLVLIDLHAIELNLYRTIEHHFLARLPGEDAIVSEPGKVLASLHSLCIEMDNRYDLLHEASVRYINEYNHKFGHRLLNPQRGHQFLPFIVIVVDDFANLVMSLGDNAIPPTTRLARQGHLVGIHLLISWNLPSPKALTNALKPIFLTRAACKVASRDDSRSILDQIGAEKLLGDGDMLLSMEGTITRLQSALIETTEVEQVADFIGSQRGYPEAYQLPEFIDEEEMETNEFDLADRDPRFEEAARLIVSEQLGSTSLIQRKLKLGYNRTGRIMDQLETAGIVGQGMGSKPRDVLIKSEIELERYLRG